MGKHKQRTKTRKLLNRSGPAALQQHQPTLIWLSGHNSGTKSVDGVLSSDTDDNSPPKEPLPVIPMCRRIQSSPGRIGKNIHPTLLPSHYVGKNFVPNIPDLLKRPTLPRPRILNPLACSSPKLSSEKPVGTSADDGSDSRIVRFLHTSATKQPSSWLRPKSAPASGTVTPLSLRSDDVFQNKSFVEMPKGVYSPGIVDVTSRKSYSTNISLNSSHLSFITTSSAGLDNTSAIGGEDINQPSVKHSVRSVIESAKKNCHSPSLNLYRTASRTTLASVRYSSEQLTSSGQLTSSDETSTTTVLRNVAIALTEPVQSQSDTKVTRSLSPMSQTQMFHGFHGGSATPSPLLYSAFRDLVITGTGRRSSISTSDSSLQRRSILTDLESLALPLMSKSKSPPVPLMRKFAYSDYGNKEKDK